MAGHYHIAMAVLLVVGVQCRKAVGDGEAESSKRGIGLKKKKSRALTTAEEMICWSHASRSFDEGDNEGLSYKTQYALGTSAYFRWLCSHWISV